ncbi:NADPH-dependent F420 reductase [Nocardia cyriacigeorgica]|uniref:NAD(P)-binding domain-containing protein n=1 Tax=Nocardia cyriacigeorgica TaxID=135487 RepID=A0A6P1D465_9NOCA|nr:NAD(P)-binding domain-containing protein [Nocardia cyriacigeorgica]NEW43920.1 NAD(P)-binding domain-containing protein [Nocardia cyriacigeorgica]
MRIGIIGAGQMAQALGGGWAAAGHDVLIGARDRAAAAAAAHRIGHGADSGDIRDAAGFGEVVLLAVPVGALDDILSAAADEMVGRAVIDCTNAFAPDTAAPEGVTAFILSEDAVAERIAEAAPGAQVVKAFNVCAAEVFASPTRVFENRPLAVPICGDDPAALQLVSGLVEDLRLVPALAGGLHRARYLEATSVFTVGMWFAGYDVRAVFPPVEAAFAVTD